MCGMRGPEKDGRMRSTRVKVNCWADLLYGLRIGRQFDVCYQQVNMRDLRLPPRSRWELFKSASYRNFRFPLRAKCAKIPFCSIVLMWLFCTAQVASISRRAEYPTKQRYQQQFNYQLTHTTLKNVELLKHFKINKNAPTCFGLQGNHHQGATGST